MNHFTSENVFLKNRQQSKYYWLYVKNVKQGKYSNEIFASWIGKTLQISFYKIKKRRGKPMGKDLILFPSTIKKEEKEWLTYHRWNRIGLGWLKGSCHLKGSGCRVTIILVVNRGVDYSMIVRCFSRFSFFTFLWSGHYCSFVDDFTFLLS